MAVIEDFGQKIGGARKDVWKITGITREHFSEMNDVERASYIKKDNVWIRPDWVKVVAEGTPQAVAYWQNEMRKAIPPRPPEASEEGQRNFVDVVSEIRDAVMAVRSREEVERFYRDFLIPRFTNGRNAGYYTNKQSRAIGIVTSKVMSAAQTSYSKLERKAKQKLFGVAKDEKVYAATKQNLTVYCYDGDSVKINKSPYNENDIQMILKNPWGSSYRSIGGNSVFRDLEQWELGTYFVMDNNGKILRNNIPSKEEAEAFVESFANASQIASTIKDPSKENVVTDSNRKKNFVPPQLQHMRYSGPHYRGVRHADGQMFMDDLGFRAGEFGNWLNDNDRQTNLDMAYDALRNLADLLKIRQEDVSLNGSLAIAFGARGRGGASAGAAHYEPDRQVINLTKMSGAGCLAHEWFHSLDHALGMSLGETGLASEIQGFKAKELPESFKDLMDKLMYKEVVVSAGERKLELDSEIAKDKKRLLSWLKYVKPSEMPDDLNAKWDAAESRILENLGSFTGMEYFNVGRGAVQTHPDVEVLSQIRKAVIHQVIPRKEKQAIVYSAAALHRDMEKVVNLAAEQRKVKTDFYNGSIEFDNQFSRMGHGYWQSKCEMLARAFDCYIADKIKESGYQSDYLSSYADSFYFKKDGGIVAAFPRGEERKVIGRAFDRLFEELKERGILQEPVAKQRLGLVDPERDLESTGYLTMDEKRFSDEPKRFEQLSLDELMFAAASKVQKGSGSGRDFSGLER